MVKWSKGHFNSVALILRNIPDSEIKEKLCDTFIELFENDNPRFNKHKFLDAVYLHKCTKCKKYKNALIMDLCDVCYNNVYGIAKVCGSNDLVIYKKEELE